MPKTTKHPNFSIEKAHKTQTNLSKHIQLKDQLPTKIRYIAGIDTAYTKDTSIGAAAVLEFPTMKLIETKTATCKTRFPYIPTLLSFREIPPSIQAIQKLHTQPDIFLVDGHGYAHPYRCGFASHLGLILKKPTIGVAKQKLTGTPKHTNNDIAYIRHKGETIGAKLTPKPNQKPIYISVGNMISLETAIKIARQCTLNNRLPEPIRAAHQAAADEKRKINNPTHTNTRNK
jgi:deoxyribonuclease V